MESKRTSVTQTFNVESTPVWKKILWSCFSCSVIKFANFLTNKIIVALTGEFIMTFKIAFLWQPNLCRFKRVALEEHSRNRVFH